MTRIAPVHWRKFEKVVLHTGFFFARQVGSHRSYTKPGVSRPVVIPTYSELPVFVIHKNLKTMGVGHDEYLRMLRELT